jgi:hypothetical protein
LLKLRLQLLQLLRRLDVFRLQLVELFPLRRVLLLLLLLLLLFSFGAHSLSLSLSLSLLEKSQARFSR